MFFGFGVILNGDVLQPVNGQLLGDRHLGLPKKGVCLWEEDLEPLRNFHQGVDAFIRHSWFVFFVFFLNKVF